MVKVQEAFSTQTSVLVTIHRAFYRYISENLYGRKGAVNTYLGAKYPTGKYVMTNTTAAADNLVKVTNIIDMQLLPVNASYATVRYALLGKTYVDNLHCGTVFAGRKYINLGVLVASVHRLGRERYALLVKPLPLGVCSLTGQSISSGSHFSAFVMGSLCGNRIR